MASGAPKGSGGLEQDRGLTPAATNESKPYERPAIERRETIVAFLAGGIGGIGGGSI